jgi:hypothetical protein
MHAQSFIPAWPRVLILLLTAAVVTVAGSRPGAERARASTFPGANGLLAVVRAEGVGSRIFVVRPDGTDGHWLTRGRGHDPSWSPDGTKSLFLRRADVRFPDSTTVWVADERGRRAMQRAIVGFGFADWSPDGIPPHSSRLFRRSAL